MSWNFHIWSSPPWEGMRSIGVPVSEVLWLDKLRSRPVPGKEML